MSGADKFAHIAALRPQRSREPAASGASALPAE